MAKLGFRRFDDMIGQMDRLDMRSAIAHSKAQGLDFHASCKPGSGRERRTVQLRRSGSWSEKAIDHQLIEQAKPALERVNR